MCVYITFSLSIQPPTDTQVGCFHILAIVNNAMMDLGVQILFDILISLPSDICLEVGFLSRLYGSFIFNFFFFGHAAQLVGS